MSSSDPFNNPNIPPKPTTTAGPPSGSSASASSKTGDIKSAVAGKAREAAAELREQSSSAVENLKQTGSDYAAERKEEASERIEGYGRELRDAAENFDERDPNIAWATHRIADRLIKLGDYVRDRDLQGLWNDAEDVARKHPVAFIGGMFIAGAAMGTLVRAVGSDRPDDSPSFHGEASSRSAFAPVGERSSAGVSSDVPSNQF